MAQQVTTPSTSECLDYAESDDTPLNAVATKLHRSVTLRIGYQKDLHGVVRDLAKGTSQL